MIDSFLQRIEGLSLPFPAGRLLKFPGEFVDLETDIGAQQLESGDACQRYERCGNCVFGEFQTTFVLQEFPEHSINPPPDPGRLTPSLHPGSTSSLLPGQ